MSPVQNPAGIPVIPAPKSGAEVYNGIMGTIEPELMTDQIPLMKEKYKDETPEQKKARGQRYAKAMEEYDRCYAQYLQEQDAKVRSFKIGAIHYVEERASQRDRKMMQPFESSFGSHS